MVRGGSPSVDLTHGCVPEESALCSICLPANMIVETVAATSAVFSQKPSVAASLGFFWISARYLILPVPKVSKRRVTTVKNSNSFISNMAKNQAYETIVLPRIAAGPILS